MEEKDFFDYLYELTNLKKIPESTEQIAFFKNHSSYGKECTYYKKSVQLLFHEYGPLIFHLVDKLYENKDQLEKLIREKK